MRVWFNGRTAAFQAVSTDSISVTRSIGFYAKQNYDMILFSLGSLAQR